MERWLTLQQTARLMDLDETTVSELVEDGFLPRCQIEAEWRVPLSSAVELEFSLLVAAIDKSRNSESSQVSR